MGWTCKARVVVVKAAAPPLCQFGRLSVHSWSVTVAFAGLVVVSVPTQLPNELEAVFRSGGSFDSGFEFLAALQLMVSKFQAQAST
mgnify:CR=1 FL=1